MYVMNKFMTITEARKNLYEIVDEATHPGFAVALTHNGTPKVVVMSFEEYENWQETMEIMADRETDKELEEAMKEMKAGTLHKDAIPWEQVKKKLKL